ncbi:MAG: hypothetical protein WDN76_00330 [Alphaproteobacteria bacterium]
MANGESHLFNVFAHPEQVFVRGEGMWLIDDRAIDTSTSSPASPSTAWATRTRNW